jgi:hypothetical protein
MSPLLYIILLTTVLLLMLYWVLSSFSPRRERRIRVPDREFAFESAQELFKYLETGEFYLPGDSLKLMPAESGHLRAYWHLKQEKWQEILKQVDNKTGEEYLVLRLHQGEDSYQEVPVKKPAGSYDWEVSGESPCSISLGIKSRDNYRPVLISDKLKQT